MQPAILGFRVQGMVRPSLIEEGSAKRGECTDAVVAMLNYNLGIMR